MRRGGYVPLFGTFTTQAGQHRLLNQSLCPTPGSSRRLSTRSGLDPRDLRDYLRNSSFMLQQQVCRAEDSRHPCRNPHAKNRKLVLVLTAASRDEHEQPSSGQGYWPSWAELTLPGNLPCKTAQITHGQFRMWVQQPGRFASFACACLLVPAFCRRVPPPHGVHQSI